MSKIQQKTESHNIEIGIAIDDEDIKDVTFSIDGKSYHLTSMETVTPDTLELKKKDDNYYLLDGFNEEFLLHYYMIGTDIYNSQNSDSTLDILPLRNYKIRNHKKIYKKIFNDLDIVKRERENGTNNVNFDEYVKILSSSNINYDDINLVPILHTNKIQLFKDKMIDWLKYNKVECNYYNIDIITPYHYHGVIVRNCLLDYYLENDKMDRIKFNYFKNIKLMIRTKCTISHVPDLQLYFNPEDTFQKVINISFKKIVKRIARPGINISKDIDIDNLENFPNFLNSFILYDNKFTKICNHEESKNIKLKDYMKFAGCELYLHQSIADSEPIFIKSVIKYPGYDDYFQHVYSADFSINDYTTKMINPLFNNFYFAKKGKIKLNNISDNVLNISLNKYVEKFNNNDRNIYLEYTFYKKESKFMKKANISVNKKVKSESMDTVLQDLLTNFGTFESCVNKEKIECERWKDYKIKQSNIHNIKWNINSKKTNEKKKKNDSSIKININIPLKERCI